MPNVMLRFLLPFLAYLLMLSAAIQPVHNVRAQGANDILLTMTFSPEKFEAGGRSTLVITLKNPTSVDFTSLKLTNTLPDGLELVDPANVTTTCLGGSIMAANRTPATITLSGAGLPGGTECTITADVTTNAADPGQAYVNIISAGSIETDQGATNQDSATSTVTTYPTGKGITGTIGFDPKTIMTGESSRLRIRFTAPADQKLTNFSFTHTLPAGLIISDSTAPSFSACGNTSGASLTANPGSNQITLKDATINAGKTCSINVYVTSSASGTYTDSIDPANIQNDQAQTIPEPVSATLRVTGLNVSKAFSPNIIKSDGHSTLTITVQNTSPYPLTNLNLTDKLTTMGGTAPSSGVYIANPPNASTTCGSATITATAGSQTLTLTGGTVPAQVGSVPGTCTIVVDVQARGEAITRTNTIAVNNVSATIDGSSTIINPVAKATADLTVTALEPHLTLSITSKQNLDKAGPDDRVDAGDTIEYTFTVENTGDVTLTNITLTDTVTGVVGQIISLDLDPGDKTTFTSTYTLTQNNINTGELTNTAEVSGTSPTGQTVNALASDTQTLKAAPSIALTKEGELVPSIVLPNTRADGGMSLTIPLPSRTPAMSR